MNDDNQVVVELNGPHQIRYEETMPPVDVPTGNSYTFSYDKGQLSVVDSFNQSLNGFAVKQSMIKPQADTRMVINGRTQPGDFLMGLNVDGRLVPVVVLDRQRYLKGVVPKEMSASWHIEALKAQAVAARTYSIKQMHKHDADGYDICDYQHCQVYGGDDVGNFSSDTAVEATKGLVLHYRGLPANTFYHASSGGFVENSEDIFNSPLGYIKADDDPFSTLTDAYDWERTITSEQLSTRMVARGYDIGNVHNLRIDKQLPSGRIAELTVIGDNGQATFKKEYIRAALGYDVARSLLFTIQGGMPTLYRDNGSDLEPLATERVYVTGASGDLELVDTAQAHLVSSSGVQPLVVKSDSFTLTGKGWGHGLGMSQVGAKYMAEQGFNFEDILAFYYKNTELITIEVVNEDE